MLAGYIWNKTVHISWFKSIYLLSENTKSTSIIHSFIIIHN